ncbi:hypothetical protein [Parasutterella muris]|uniref:hypothetical protein n=1 Tax=Parasutterella muris TaxID=2565572 RepID=UPI00203C21D0|nr:hypothetical protein [Parasutterella muris]
MKHMTIEDRPAIVFTNREDYSSHLPTEIEENTVFLFNFIKNKNDLIEFLHFDRKNSLDYSREFDNAPAEQIADWLTGSEGVGRVEFTDLGMIDYIEV